MSIPTEESTPEVVQQPEPEKPIKVELPKSNREVTVEQPQKLTTFRANADVLKYPRHILAQTARGKRETNIRIGEKRGGQQYWWITPNPEIGIPSKLAFDFDYQILLPKIYEATRKARQSGAKLGPRYVVVGSLRQIARELGRNTSGRSLAEVKDTLRANQATTIETGQAIRFLNEDGNIEHLSGQFNAYNIYIRGDHLPDGDEVKKVIIELSIPFWQAVNSLDFAKPLDGHYFKQLQKPGPQRWYTMVSTNIFAAIKHKLPTAKVRYSEYCQFHPQKRHKAFSDMKRQMEKLHKKHVEFNYIKEPQYQETTDDRGLKDWFVLYKPAELAYDEYQQNRKRQPQRQSPKELQPQEPTGDYSQPAYNLVGYFQHQKNGLDLYSPKSRELEQAAALIAKHGDELTRKIVGFALDEMDKTNFDAKHFGAVMSYETQALKHFALIEKQKKDKQEQQATEYQQKLEEYQHYRQTPIQSRVDQRMKSWPQMFEGFNKRPPTEQEAEAHRVEIFKDENITPAEKQKSLFGKVIFSKDCQESDH